MSQFKEYEIMDFRVFDVNEKEMKYSKDVKNKNQLYMLATKNKNIMFSSGKFDDDNNEIYRGDIIELFPKFTDENGELTKKKDKRYICLIDTKDKSFKIGRKLKDPSDMNTDLAITLKLNKSKIIGNVFHDQKLLGKELKDNGSKKSK